MKRKAMITALVITLVIHYYAVAEAYDGCMYYTLPGPGFDDSITGFEGRADNIWFDYDADGVAHVLYTKDDGEDALLYYMTNETGEFGEPEELSCLIDGCRGLDSVMDEEGVIHLVWRDEPDGYHLGKLHYAIIKDRTLMDHTLLYDQAHIDVPSITLDSDGDVHVVFQSRFREDDDTMPIYYTCTENGVFQPLEKTTFSETPSIIVEPEICVNSEETVFIFGSGFQLFPSIKRFKNGEFLPTVVIYEHTYFGYRTKKFIQVDDTDLIHLTFVIEYFGSMPMHAMIHLTTRDGVTFSAPDLLSHTHHLFFPISDPLFHSDGSIQVLNYYKRTEHFDSGYQIDRGYGFGNRRQFTNKFLGFFSRVEDWTGPVCRILPDDRLGILYAGIPYYTTHYSSINFIEISPDEITEPWVDILTFDNIYGKPLYQNDTHSVTLDVYNPTDEQIECELVVVVKIYCESEYSPYYFLTDLPTYPTFQEDYVGFPITLPPGWWCQNVPIFEFDLTVPNPELDYLELHWYAALYDPIRGELISDISYSHTGYAYDVYP